MKTLNNYTGQSFSKALDQAGAFFAFGQKQFDQARKPDVKYKLLGGGLICPTKNADDLVKFIHSINKEGIEQDMAENGKKAIIHRELANHEAQITMSINDTVDALEEYPITREDVRAEWKEYLKFCVDNDYF